MRVILFLMKSPVRPRLVIGHLRAADEREVVDEVAQPGGLVLDEVRLGGVGLVPVDLRLVHLDLRARDEVGVVVELAQLGGLVLDEARHRGHGLVPVGLRLVQGDLRGEHRPIVAGRARLGHV